MALIALDTETESFDVKAGITPRNAKLRGVSVAYGDDLAEYTENESRWPLLYSEDDTVIFHKYIFDAMKLSQAGLPIPSKFEDTKVAAILCDENRLSALKPLAKDILGLDVVEYKELDLQNEEAFASYAKNDAVFTRRLFVEHFDAELDRQGLRQVYELEKEVLPVVLAMNQRGMLVDRSKLDALATEVTLKLNEAKDKVFSILLAEKLNGRVFETKEKEPIDLSELNINSTKQIGVILYECFKFKIPKKTKTGKPSTDDEALGSIGHPLTDSILEYRTYQKLASAFTDKLPAHIDEDGRIRPEYNQLGAATGRFSCSKPNLQQIPAHSELGKKLRQCFVAPPGRKLVVADFSQIELRVLAHYSQDKNLKAAYCSAEEVDLHFKTASLVLNKPIEEITKDERFIAKTINFSIAYSVTDVGLFKRLTTMGIEVTQNQCTTFIEKYFQTYSGVRTFLDRVAQTIRQRHFVKSLYGRRRRLAGRSPREIRQAQNFIIQGSAADLAKHAMVRVAAKLPATAFLVAAVHDELVTECDAADAELVYELMQEEMCRTPASFRVPIKVDINIVNSWGEAK